MFSHPAAEPQRALLPESFRLRARLVLTMTGDIWEDGVVAVAGGRVRAVGRHTSRWDHPGPLLDLGEVVLMPGLINAHCHLDYTHMAGFIAPPKHFTDWIQALVSLKSNWSYSEFAASWIAGARALLESGTTTVADVEAVPELLPDLWRTTPLRVVSFHELIHLRPPPPVEQRVEEAVAAWEALPQASGRVGLSPHAPYTTSPELLQRAAGAARRRGWRLVTHVAESEEEYLMFTERRGAMHDWLRLQRDLSDCGHGTPLQALERVGYLGPDLLAVHANYLGPGDVRRLRQHGVHVVHCPGSHAYFRHQPFALQRLQAAGVNVCLGTDSLASMPRQGRALPSLDLWRELRTLAGTHPGQDPSELLRMVTVHGAVALGQRGHLGVLAPGAWADLITLPYAGPAAEAEAALVEGSMSIGASMIGGEWARPPESSWTRTG